ncbi:fumarylacetoacetate hydrolase, partial [Streptomyces sp. DT225]
RPGSAEAAALKELLVARGMWSQYLEVGIGPDAEIFTKAPVLAAVGTATDAGVLSTSRWNNPEPEMVLVVSSAGEVVGATLGNDVNLRDVEGRSALLLSKAKDNNASAVLGPFVRLFDASFGMDDVRKAAVTLTVEGEEGYRLDAVSSMSAISRDPLDLVGQLIGPHHRYPDGAV